MVTILLGEQEASIALSSHSGPTLIYSDLRRPGQWTMRWTDTHKHTLRDRGRDTIIRHTVQQAVWHQRTY